MTGPVVTIVLITFDDAGRLPRAVRSVQRQTRADWELVVVDDASTDGTPELVAALAAADDRIRPVRLATNSGGCAVPRNAGIDAARGTYVMFLDSDDELAPGAVASLVGTAERTGADVVSGRLRRYHVQHGTYGQWYDHVYARHRVLADVADEPDLLFDTVVVNTCFRTAFLHDEALRFPVGMHYEDLPFMTEAYAAAARIALVPDLVYTWYVDEPGDARTSITASRLRIDNVRDRIAAHRRTDEVLRRRSRADLVAHKDHKFLRHDLRLYLRDLVAATPPYQREFLALVGPYVATLDSGAVARAGRVEQIVYAGLVRGDLDLVLSGTDWVERDHALSTELARRDDRVLWAGRDTSADPELAALLDVTDELADLLPDRLPPYACIEAVSAEGGALVLHGWVRGQLGALDGDDVVLVLELVPRSGRTLEVPVPWRRDGERLVVSIAIPADVAGGSVGPLQRWELVLRCTVAAGTVRAPLRSGVPGPSTDVVVRPPGSLLAAAGLRLGLQVDPKRRVLLRARLAGRVGVVGERVFSGERRVAAVRTLQAWRSRRAGAGEP
jgi:CDP-glycerol glycerophosphotransferase